MPSGCAARKTRASWTPLSLRGRERIPEGALDVEAFDSTWTAAYKVTGVPDLFLGPDISIACGGLPNYLRGAGIDALEYPISN